MDGPQLSPTHVHVWATSVPTDKPVAEEEEYYSSWSLFLVCLLLILSLWTSYYLQIKRIRVIHETLVSIFAGMFVGLIVRLAPGTMIREMLVRGPPLYLFSSTYLDILDIQTHTLLQSAPPTDYSQFWLRTEASAFTFLSTATWSILICLPSRKTSFETSGRY